MLPEATHCMGRQRIFTTVERVLQHVRAALVDIEKSYRARARSAAELGAEQLAERMVAAVPLPSPVNERIGPFYRGEQVAKLPSF